MKRLLLILISILLAFSLFACKDDDTEQSSSEVVDERYDLLPQGFIISEVTDLLGYRKTAVSGEIKEDYATVSLINSFIATGYKVEWISDTVARIEKGMDECFLDLEQLSLKYRGEECIIRAPALENFIVEAKGKDLIIDTVTLKYALTWSGYPCRISYSYENKDKGIIIEDMYYDEDVKSFDVNDYKDKISANTVSKTFPYIYDSISLKSCAYELWDEIYVGIPVSQDTYEAFFDTKSNTWYVRGTLAQGTSVGVPHMIVRTDGVVLAAWTVK